VFEWIEVELYDMIKANICTADVVIDNSLGGRTGRTGRGIVPPDLRANRTSEKSLFVFYVFFLFFRFFVFVDFLVVCLVFVFFHLLSFTILSCYFFWRSESAHPLCERGAAQATDGSAASGNGEAIQGPSAGGREARAAGAGLFYCQAAAPRDDPQRDDSDLRPRCPPEKLGGSV